MRYRDAVRLEPGDEVIIKKPRRGMLVTRVEVDEVRHEVRVMDYEGTWRRHTDIM